MTLKHHLRFWIPVYPDIKKPIGGVKQLHRVCEILNDLNYQCTLVQDDPLFHPGWFDSNVRTVSRHSWFNGSNLKKDTDIIILPETFLAGLNTIFPSIKKIIFNQNAAYTFGLPDTKKHLSYQQTIELYSSPQILQVWTVSLHDRKFISSGLRFPSERLHLIANGLDYSHSFSHSIPKEKQIAFMPRKNSDDAQIVLALLSNMPELSHWKFVAIRNFSHSEVISILQRSLVFLSFGHPEGFGLPVAEAIACGCSVVGYTGLGGRELFQSTLYPSTSYNVEYGDWMGFIDGILAILSQLNSNPSTFFTDLRYQAIDVKRRYSFAEMTNSVRHATSLLQFAAPQ